MKLKDNVRPFLWQHTGSRLKLMVLDQLLLPTTIKWLACFTHGQVARTIVDMNVRGAPAIGCVAAYAFALAAHEKKISSASKVKSYFARVTKTLAATRPTAVNLFWALDRMNKRLDCELKLNLHSTQELSAGLESEAMQIFEEDLAANHTIGRLGAKLLPKNAVVLTHCNAGSLATSGWGTSLGVIRSAYEEGKIKKVIVDETRPYLQGARLTAWELAQDKIPYQLITDNMAAHIMKTEKVDAVIVGSDRIAANGDLANKIGTYNLAVLCSYHKIPFYAAAPISTCDFKIECGDEIPIEERSAREVTHIKNIQLAPKNTAARHPAFDVTPHELVTAIITQNGVASPPSKKTMASLLTIIPALN